ncbi:MAG: SDR family NAD(P)-dependent oxidoreductase, partial [bacterium]|nr:SDR family NAD(P)-dependent oxidoreductase [bacterium]
MNDNNNNESYYTPEEISDCITLLETLINNTDQFLNIPEEQRVALLNAAGRLSRPNRDDLKKRKKARRQAERKAVTNYERKARAATGIRSAREAHVFTAPLQISSADMNTDHEQLELKSPRNCYVCKAEFTKLHFFYDSMCPACADFNYKKRFQTAPLNGQVALITGSRLKIGYHSTLMMLRAGATVIATTRFPVDSAARFSKEQDYSEWKDRLHVYGLDLRHTPSVEIFSSFIEQNYNRLDILINNAAQTVRRPPGFYSHLMENETKNINEQPQEVRHLLNQYRDCMKQLGSFSEPTTESEGGETALPVTWNGKTPGIGLRSSAELSQVPYSYDHALAVEKVFPQGKLDADLQQVDLRETNSWRLRLGEIQTSEMLEVQLVNIIAPFVLCNRLVSLMKRDNTGQKHIVNVTAMEGKFYRFKKTDRHPHTNIAKA